MIRYERTEIDKLYKKAKRLERKYSKLAPSAKTMKARLLRQYLATARKIDHLTGRELK